MEMNLREECLRDCGVRGGPVLLPKISLLFSPAEVKPHIWLFSEVSGLSTNSPTEGQTKVMMSCNTAILQTHVMRR